MALRIPDAESFLNRSVPGLAASSRAVHAGYSRFVGFMKVVLPGVAAILLLLLVIWPRLDSTRVDGNSPTSARVGGGVDTLSMNKPRYFGTDERNLPFTVTAEQARETDTQNLTVELTRPQSDFTRQDGSSVIVSADSGLYTQKTNTLDLTGHVDLFIDNGYELHTERAHVLLGKSQVSGDAAFTAQGPTGDLAGQGFRVLDSGQNVACLGSCKATLRMGLQK